jgi:hypothetical protein
MPMKCSSRTVGSVAARNGYVLLVKAIEDYIAHNNADPTSFI